MDLELARQQMRHAYHGGATGMLASAIVWGIAGLIASRDAFVHAVLALFIGGMAIHPAGMLLARLLGRPGSAKGNPLEQLALETTGMMILCLPLAYALSRYRPDWFFPAMLLIIGGRYLVFASIYGLRVYWACGGALAMAAWGAAIAGLPPAPVALAGAAIEAAFAAAIFAATRGQGAGRASA